MTDAGLLIRKTAEKLWQMQDLPVIAACTEIPLAWRASDLPEDRMISSLEALSRACIRRLYPGTEV
jgi:aspartate racemase